MIFQYETRWVRSQKAIVANHINDPGVCCWKIIENDNPTLIKMNIAMMVLEGYQIENLKELNLKYCL